MLHPLRQFRFCPMCGSSSFEVHDFKSKRCASCGFTYYHNASAAVVAVVFDAQQRLLVTRRAFDPAKGTLDLPGGFVDAGETAEESCLREVREELGVEAHIQRYLFSLPNTYLFSHFDVHTTDLFFLCTLPTHAVVQAQDDAAAAFFMPQADIHPEAFGLVSIRRGIERLMKRED